MLENFCNLDFKISHLGQTQYDSAILYKLHKKMEFIDDKKNQVSYFLEKKHLKASDRDKEKAQRLLFLEQAGPRASLFFPLKFTKTAIVSCGGLCPGINNVIRNVVRTLYFDYGICEVLGFRYGYRGLLPEFNVPPLPLTLDNVDNIHFQGGSILGTSRGHGEKVKEMIKTLVHRGISILFTVGGDGTLKGAYHLAQEIQRQNLNISVVGIPKTIDNDIKFIDYSFGFETAVAESVKTVTCAHVEAKSVINGVGLIQLMGRQSGFIAASTSIASGEVNYCLIPEVPLHLEGPQGFLENLYQRLLKRQHAVIVAAEGVGQQLFRDKTPKKDASGNLIFPHIGIYLKKCITDYLKQKNMVHKIKYFDPSYSIRSVPANTFDAGHCARLASGAVHAAMAGKTSLMISHLSTKYVHVPLKTVIKKRKTLPLEGSLFKEVLRMTQYNPFIELSSS